MKIFFKYICLCVITMGLYSCEEDDDLSYETAGANVVLVDNSISVLDQNEELTIELSDFGNDIQSVQVQDTEGNVLTDATIGSDSSATFSTSALGELTSGESINVFVVSTLTNGQVVRQPFTIEVTDAITLVNDPGMVRFLDTTPTSLSFSTSTLSAPIDNVSLFRRTNLDDTFMEVDDAFNIEADSIDLGAIDYEELGVGIGDTIFYRFEAQSGNLSQTVETQVIIETQNFGDFISTSLSSEPAMAAYNLSEAEYAEEGESGELIFMDPIGFSTADGIDFVQVDVPDDMDATDYISELDLFEAEMAYEDGNVMTSIDEVEMGDVFIYKTTRDGSVVYGVIQIGDTTILNTNGEEISTFDFQYAEGSIIRE